MPVKLNVDIALFVDIKIKHMHSTDVYSVSSLLQNTTG